MSLNHIRHLLRNTVFHLIQDAFSVLSTILLVLSTQLLFSILLLVTFVVRARGVLLVKLDIV
jgi:hypothetical protein